MKYIEEGEKYAWERALTNREKYIIFDCQINKNQKHVSIHNHMKVSRKMLLKKEVGAGE